VRINDGVFLKNMSGMNHKVAFKSEETIAAIAARCWAASEDSRPFTFDVVGFLKNVLIGRSIDTIVRTRGRKKGKLSIKFFDREFPQEDPAYVEFDPSQRDNYVTLHVDRRIWQLAENGDSYACWVLAHEIGHILFDLLPFLPSFISRVCSGFGPDWGGMQTRSV
jgi:hypothetical protein